MLFAEQVRAARALLGWGQMELVEKTGLGIATIRRLEAMTGPVRTTTDTAWKLQKVFTKAGIIFIDPDAGAGPGVRLVHTPGQTG